MEKGKFITIKVDREIIIPDLQETYTMRETIPNNKYLHSNLSYSENVEISQKVYHRLSFKRLTGWPDGKIEDLNYYIAIDEIKEAFEFVDWVIRLETLELRIKVSELGRELDRMRSSLYEAMTELNQLRNQKLKNRIKSFITKIKVFYYAKIKN